MRYALPLLLLLACEPKETQPDPAAPAPLPLAASQTGPAEPARDPPRDPPMRHARGDRDGDGIPDDFDKCPDEPEDRDGFQDEDGCPDPDNDQDGIPDVQDKCPNNPGRGPSGCP